jgi:hypothetical protein
VVKVFTEENAHLTRKLEERSNEVNDIKALLKKERTCRRSLTHFLENYCWLHGYKVAKSHTIQNCSFPKNGHKKEAAKNNNTGGSQANKE